MEEGSVNGWWRAATSVTPTGRTSQHGLCLNTNKRKSQRWNFFKWMIINVTQIQSPEKMVHYRCKKLFNWAKVAFGRPIFHFPFHSCNMLFIILAWVALSSRRNMHTSVEEVHSPVDVTVTIATGVNDECFWNALWVNLKANQSLMIQTLSDF